jgi:WD40 repeat protein
MDKLVVSKNGENCLIIAHNQFKIIGINDRAILGGFEGGKAVGIVDIEYSPDGKLLLLGCKDRSIKICDSNTGNLMFSNRSHTGRVYEVNFSPNGREFISVGEDGLAKRFETPYLDVMISKGKKILGNSRP